MTLENALRARRSVPAFLPTEVPDVTLRGPLNDAVQFPR